MATHVPIDPATLERAGTAYAGQRWKGDVADLLGWAQPRIYQVLRGDRPMPIGAARELAAALRARAADAQAAADQLEALVAAAEAVG